jgi:predicted lipoprotein with Yx(FWY)xxD motif
VNRVKLLVGRQTGRICRQTACIWALASIAALVSIGTAAAAISNAGHLDRRERRAPTTVVRSRVNSHVLARIVVDSSGYTLYAWLYGRGCCTHSYPNFPNFRRLIARGQVIAAPGSKINDHKLGTRKLSNGRRQVTYYGQPLYLYDGDHEPGQANAEEKQQDNGIWQVVDVRGQPLHPPY